MKELTFRNIFLLFVTVAFLLHWIKYSLLSLAITFSNQVVGLMSVWMIWTPTRNTWICDVLALYGVIIAVMFYGMIIPINGFPTDPLVIIMDFLIHICLPFLFFVYRHKFKKSTYSASFFQVTIYPFMYWIFISEQQDYPFLNDNMLMLSIFVGFMLAHISFCYEKNFKQTMGFINIFFGIILIIVGLILLLMLRPFDFAQAMQFWGANVLTILGGVVLIKNV